MPTDSDDINLIKRLCILNFLELQDIRRRLNIPTQEGPGNQGHYDYANAVRGYLKGLDDKMRNLIRDYPHLEGGPEAVKE